MYIQITIEAEERVVTADLIKAIEILDSLRSLNGISTVNISTLLSNVSNRVVNHLGICDEQCPIDILDLQEQTEEAENLLLKQ